MTLRPSSVGDRPARRRRAWLACLLAAFAVSGAVALAGPASALSPTDTVGPLSASGCTARTGPGTFTNESCVYVKGSGTHVQRIRGAMVSVNRSVAPVQLCNVKVHVWATYANGAKFDHVGDAACSYLGNAWVEWYPNAHFRDQTSVCARTAYKGKWSTPACVQIRA